MILIFLALGAGVLTTLLAVAFGDISALHAMTLSLGFMALGIGLGLLRLQSLRRHQATQSQATLSARQYAENATPSWHAIAGLALAILGALDLLWACHELLGT